MIHSINDIYSKFTPVTGNNDENDSLKYINVGFLEKEMLIQPFGASHYFLLPVTRTRVRCCDRNQVPADVISP